MKKAYVTPVMESEAFVANEYVAACYLVTCIVHENSFKYPSEPTRDKNDNDGFYCETYWGTDVWYYNGDKLGETYIGDAHPVKLEKIDTPDHPNASV